MPLYYNISPEPQVLDWSQPAVMPGAAIDVSDAQAPGLSPTIWSLTPPSEMVTDEVPEKAKKNTSGSLFGKRDQPAPEVPQPEETPVAPEAPAPNEEAK